MTLRQWIKQTGFVVCGLLAGLVGGSPRAQVTEPPAAPSRSDGISPELDFSQLNHAVLGPAAGAPLWPSDIAQDTDGFLWFANDDGLYRFDGVRFDQPYQAVLPAHALSAVHIAPNDDVWVGFSHGGAARIRKGVLTSFAAAPGGLPQGTVFAFVRTPDGTLWAGTTGGLARLVDDRWKTVGTDMGFHSQELQRIYLDHNQSLWVDEGGTFSVLRLHAARFASATTTQMEQEVFGVPPPGIPESPKEAMSYADRRGALWAFARDGIHRWTRRPGRDGHAIEHPDTFTAADGLSDFTASAFFEDREGGIWLGTTAGVDHFTQNRLTPMPLPRPVLNPLVAVDSGGQAWIGGRNGNFRYTNALLPAPELGERPTAVSTDAEGTVWFAGRSWITSINHGVVSRVELPAELHRDGVEMQAIVHERSGDLFLAAQSFGLYRLHGDAWERLDKLAGQPTTHIRRLLIDVQDRMWVSFPENILAMRSGDQWRVWTARDGLAVGNILAIDVHGDHTWLGGDGGLQRIGPAGLTPLLDSRARTLRGITGIVERSNGEVWLQDSRGILRFSTSEVGRMIADPTYHPEGTLFGADDGLTGGVDMVRPLPSLTQGPDGRLWAITSRTVVSIDPDHLLRNTVEPTPHIMSVSTADRRYPASEAAFLPSHTSNFSVTFTAASLSMPKLTRFRYRLDGADISWREAGDRREVDYGNLAPGHYTFRLTAMNEDGLTSATEARVDINLAPTFYQTWWFRLICTLSVLGLVWLVYAWRVRVIEARTSIRLHERERIARDLHDTLLQSVQGLLLRIHAAIRTPMPEPTRQMLETAGELARSAVVEARDKVHLLRAGAADESLLDALVDFAEHLGSEGRSAFDYRETGHARRLQPDASLELQSVIKEALSNAFMHSQATRISLDLHYAASSLTIRVVDNGIGIDEGVLATGYRPGHWGLRTMRQRMAVLGGRLDIRSDAEGTRITTILGASSAYLHKKTVLSRLLGRVRRSRNT